jgi:predicted acylesterase/phospholipase RssA
MKRNCDVVMKGGITSGVVYPKAIVRLSERFRLRNVGGTSAGAIAAAAAAAAQHGDATGQGTGFSGLEKLPGYLETNLEKLFQPEDSTEPLFEVVLAATKARRGFWPKLGAISNSAFAVFRLWGIVGLLPGVGLGAVLIYGNASGWALVAGLVAAVLVAVIGLVAGLAIAMILRVLSAVPANYFGLCTGYQPDERIEPKPLTTWLTDEIDKLAGTPNRAQPLTFGDLWGPDPDGDRAIDLRMISTCLTHGAAYELPMTAHGRWFFNEEEFRALFPKRVVNWMVCKAPPVDRGVPVEGLHPLPRPADMPVVVAARMSLSFPGLISAVPLWTVDRGRKDRRAAAYEAHEAWKHGERAKFDREKPWLPERCWFSDGGITSNFPIQFFDSPVPRWPTFGINLREFGRGWDRDLEDESKNIEMAFDNKDGRAEPWTDLDGKGNFKRLAAFAGAIMNTSRGWMDNSQMRIPGYRDRIVHIGHDEDEGGMNLSMPPNVIAHLSERGKKAADELIRRFDEPPDTPYPLDWKNQRWVRYRAYMTELEESLSRFRRGCMCPLDGDPTIAALSGRGEGQPPKSYNWKYDAGLSSQRDLAVEATNRLNSLAEFWENSGESVEPGTPDPRPQLRLTPRL